MPTSTEALTILRQKAAEAEGLQLLVLHGSRARGDGREDSDWDLAYLGSPDFDPDDFLARLVVALGTDRVDLARLDGAGGLFRYRVAADGQVIYESESGLFERFWMAAVTFWCEAEPILKKAYQVRLTRLINQGKAAPMLLPKIGGMTALELGDIVEKTVWA